MHKPPEPPGYQRLAFSSLRHKVGTSVLLLLALASASLFLAAASKGSPPGLLSPALKAGLGFFGSMTLACMGGYWWMVRRNVPEDHLRVGERLIATRHHRDVPVFRASHCWYFAGVCDAVAYRKALSGLVVGTHVFYLEDGAYLTEAGVRLTVGKEASRSAVVFMRAFQAYLAHPDAHTSS